MKGVDLLPQGVAKPKSPALFSVTALVIISLFVLLISFLYTAKTGELNRAREALSILESDFAGFRWVEEELASTRKRKKDVESKLELAMKETENPLPADRILKDLPALMPQGVRLVQLSLASEGRVLFHAEATALSQAAGLGISLDQSGMFHDLKLQKVTRVNEVDGIYRLEATGKLSPIGGD
jgi:hypothetical protein